MTQADSPDDRPRIAVDTSVLMAPIEADVRVFEELDRLVPGGEWLVPESVRGELRALSDGNGEEGTAAAVGLELADRCRPVETDAEYADDALVELAASGRVDYAATNDRPLADRILARDVPVISLRGRDKLAVTRP